jgi:alpha-galactosidase
MHVPRFHWIMVIFTGAIGLFAAESRAAKPTGEELAQRDRWVQEHFPSQSTTAKGTVPLSLARKAEKLPGLIVWTCLDRAFCNRLPDKPLQIGDRKFEHGIYCHAPSRIEVDLPGPAKSFSAVAGIQNSPSQGGSVVFSVELSGSENGDSPPRGQKGTVPRFAEKKLYTSPVVRRGEPGVAVNVDLNGAKQFILAVGNAGDGLSSDQAVWGDAKVTLADGKEIRLGDLPLRDPPAVERSAAVPPFSFHYGGRSSDELLPAWKFHEEQDASQPGKTIRTQTYTDPETGLAVRCVIVEYKDFPTVEWTLYFKNTGKSDTPILAGILPLDVRFERGAGGEFLLHHFTGSPCSPTDYEPFATPLGAKAEKRFDAAGGRPTNTNLPYFNLETGTDSGLIAVLSWGGQWAGQFTRDGARGLRLAAGQEATSFRLHPGEEVRSPMALLQFYEGDWIRGQNVWRSWMFAHNTPQRGGKPLPPFSWGCTGNYYPNLMTNAAGEKEFVRRFVEEKIAPEYWNQDAGWYPCGWGWPVVGTWEVDKERFPKGLREVTDFEKSHGVKAILWFEPERLAAGTWLAEHHPEWCFGGAGGGVMNIGNPDFRKWIADRVVQIITSEGINIYRQDFNIDPLLYWRGADAEDRQGITEIRYVEGYYAYWDELLRRLPELIIDSCASGGRRNDLETLRRQTVLLQRTDFTEGSGGYDPLHAQNITYGISFWMPYNGSGFGTVNQYGARSVMTTLYGVGVDTRKKDLDYGLVRKLMAQWRQISRCYLGDYYPLTPYDKTADAWAAWQFDLPDQGRGMIQAFRRQNCPHESLTVKLRGLDPEARYEVKNLDEEKSRRATGRELMETGLTVTAKEKPAALVFSYEKK